tara:strand:- start:183 stop:293 length:111 start_codon:yes stop_codon:yes gene_type:complete
LQGVTEHQALFQVLNIFLVVAVVQVTKVVLMVELLV